MLVASLLAIFISTASAAVKVLGTAKDEPVIKGGVGSLTIEGTVGKNLVFEKDVGSDVYIKGTVGDNVVFGGSVGDNVVIKGTVGSKTQFMGSFGAGCVFSGVTQEASIIKDSFQPNVEYNVQYTLDKQGNLVVLTDKIFASQHILYLSTVKQMTSGHARSNIATFDKTPGSGIIFEKPIGANVVFKGLVGNNVIFKGAIGANTVFETDIASGTTLEGSYKEGSEVKELSNTSKNTQYAPPSSGNGKKGENKKEGEKDGEDKEKKEKEKEKEKVKTKGNDASSGPRASLVAIAACLAIYLII